jgi:hypothetical protein
MQRQFSISTPTESTRTDASGRADVVFTVANTTNVPLAGLAKLVPLGAMRAEWLTLAGSEERDFPAGAIHQFAVAVNVPPGTSEGRYPFRLDVINARKAAEDLAESPIVTVDVPARAAAAKKGTSWIAIAALALLAVLGAGAYLLFRPVEAQAPAPVVNAAPAQTETAPVIKNGFNKSGATPVVESNLITVPNLISIPVSKAEWELEAAGLKATRKEVIDRAAQPGTVRMHSPKPGEKVDKGTTVELEVVIAEDLVDVPSVINVEVENAKQLIEKVGLVAVVSRMDVDYSATGRPVREQSPKGGEEVKRGTQVQLVIAYDPRQAPGR